RHAVGQRTCADRLQAMNFRWIARNVAGACVATALHFVERDGRSRRRCPSTEEIMIAKWMTAAAVAMGTFMVTGGASGQQTKDESKPNEEGAAALAPATHAVELTIGTGYAQGFGGVGSGQQSLKDMGIAGGALQIGAGYRLIPPLTLGVYGEGAM